MGATGFASACTHYDASWPTITAGATELERSFFDSFSGHFSWVHFELVILMDVRIGYSEHLRYG